MQLPQRDEVVDWVGLPVVDQQGEALGTCRHVYADDATELPEWLVTDLPDAGPVFLPLTDARVQDGRVHVTFPYEQVQRAPRFEDSGRLEPDDEVRLYEHYGVPYSEETVLPTGSAQGSDLPPAAASERASRLRRLDLAAAALPGDGPGDDTVLLTPPPVVGVDEGSALEDVPPVEVSAVPPVPAAPPYPATPFPATPSPASQPQRSALSSAEPALLGGLAVLLGVLAAVRVLRGRRPSRTDRARAKVARTTAGTGRSLARTAAQVRDQAVRTGASTGKDLAGATAQARAELAARGKDAARSLPSRTELARTAAAAGKDVAKAAASRSEQARGAAKGLASTREELARAAAARGKDAAKGLAATREDLAKAAAARRKDAAKAAKARRKDSAQAAKARRAQLAKAGAGARRSLGSAASRTRDGGSGVLHVPGRAATGVARSTARTERKVKRGWRRTTRRLTFLTGLSAGYVVGARAGRQRYVQITQAVQGLADQPAVKRALGRG